MALIFAESFDCGYGLNPWTQTGDADFLVETVPGRTGPFGRELQGEGLGGNGFLRRAFGVGEQDSTFIVGFAFFKPALVLGPGADTFFSLRSDNNATTHVSLSYNAMNQISVSGPPGTYGTTAVNTFTYDGPWIHIQLKVFLDNTNGTVELKINDVTEVMAAGVDTRAGAGEPTFDNVIWLSSTDTHYIDDVWVCNGLGGINNDFLGNVEIYCLSPNGNGAFSELEGSDGNMVDNYQLVDENPPSDADFVSGETPGDRDTYEFENLPFAFGDVKGVVLNHRSQKNASQPKQFAPVVRHGGVNDVGTLKGLSQDFTVYREYYDENPVTSSDWLVSDVNSDEYGFQVG